MLLRLNAFRKKKMLQIAFDIFFKKRDWLLKNRFKLNA
jgi:hypothetical protein